MPSSRILGGFSILGRNCRKLSETVGNCRKLLDGVGELSDGFRGPQERCEAGNWSRHRSRYPGYDPHLDLCRFCVPELVSSRFLAASDSFRQFPTVLRSQTAAAGEPKILKILPLGRNFTYQIISSKPRSPSSFWNQPI